MKSIILKKHYKMLSQFRKRQFKLYLSFTGCFILTTSPMQLHEYLGGLTRGALPTIASTIEKWVFNNMQSRKPQKRKYYKISDMVFVEQKNQIEHM